MEGPLRTGEESWLLLTGEMLRGGSLLGEVLLPALYEEEEEEEEEEEYDEEEEEEDDDRPPKKPRHGGFILDEAGM